MAHELHHSIFKTDRVLVATKACQDVAKVARASAKVFFIFDICMCLLHGVATNQPSQAALSATAKSCATTSRASRSLRFAVWRVVVV